MATDTEGTPNWAKSQGTIKPAAVEEPQDGVSFAPTSAEIGEMDMPTTESTSQLAFGKRTAAHKSYRFFKFITIMTSLLLAIAQVVSLVYLPFNALELLIKIFISSFCALAVLNELEWWGPLRDSPLFWNFISRGYFYAFVGLVSLDENEVTPSSLSPLDYPAAMFIETVSWMMFALGTLYMLFGICCGQVYVNKAREDHSKRLAERKRIFERGLQSDNALSKQMIA